MKLVKKLKYILILFLALFIPIGICTWAISGAIREEQLKAEYVVSPFTEYVLNPTNGDVIYDDTTNGNGYLGYDVSSDFTYDISDKIIELGDPKVDGGIVISNSITFGHSSNTDLNYSEDQFLNSGAFANDGTVVTSTTRLYPNSKYATNRLYTIKLTSDIVLTNNSTLSIGALIGTNGSNGSSGGVINGNFVCLDLNGYNLTINSGCTLNAYGYIIDSKLNNDGKHVGSIINNGTIYTGFVVEDYNGGGTTVGRGFASQMPFCLYSLPYLSCKVINNYGSSIKTPTMLYANSVMNKTIINWYGAGNDYFLQSKTEGSILIIDTYNNLSADGKSYAENMRSYYSFNGSFKTNSLKLTINFEALSLKVNATIDMGQFAFFIPPYADITLAGVGSSFDLNMLLQFLPGSSLKISEGTNLNFTSASYSTFVKGEGVVGFIDKEISKGTSVGGIIERTEMPPSTNSDLAYSRQEDGNTVTNSLYYFDNSHYEKFEIQEKNMLASQSSRIKLYGGLSFSSDVKHIISGFIEFGEETLTVLNSNTSYINCFTHLADTFANVNGASPLVSWATSNERPSPISYGGYINEPLVIANANIQSNTNLTGRVFNPQKTVEASFSSEVYYNFRKGYFYDVIYNKYYIYNLNDNVGTVANNINDIAVTGSINEIEGVDEYGNVIFDGNKYIYFNNAFLETDYVSDNVLTNGSGLYIYDSINNTYNKIVNGSTSYTYEAERYSIEYRGAEYVGQYEQKATVTATDSGTNWGFTHDWDNDPTRSEWSNLPIKSIQYEIPDTWQSLGYETKSSQINVSIINLNDLDTGVDTSKNIIVNASHLSQTEATYGGYSVINDAICTLTTNDQNSQPEYSEWRFDETYYLSADNSASGNGNYSSSRTVTDDSLGFGNAKRTRTEYYDYYYFQLTATYSTSNVTIENVPLYQRKIATGSSIKYDSNTDLWVKA